METVKKVGEYEIVKNEMGKFGIKDGESEIKFRYRSIEMAIEIAQAFADEDASIDQMKMSIQKL